MDLVWDLQKGGRGCNKHLSPWVRVTELQSECRRGPFCSGELKDFWARVRPAFNCQMIREGEGVEEAKVGVVCKSHKSSTPILRVLVYPPRSMDGVGYHSDGLMRVAGDQSGGVCRLQGGQGGGTSRSLEVGVELSESEKNGEMEYARGRRHKQEAGRKTYSEGVGRMRDWTSGWEQGDGRDRCAERHGCCRLSNYFGRLIGWS
eukprot:764300-Hanusia_phi.AAC.9